MKIKTEPKIKKEPSDDEDENHEMALLVRKTTKILKKLNKKGYNFNSEKSFLTR